MDRQTVTAGDLEGLKPAERDRKGNLIRHVMVSFVDLWGTPAAGVIDLLAVTGYGTRKVWLQGQSGTYLLAVEAPVQVWWTRP